MKAASQVMVVSNHYVLKTKAISFNEFHVRFIRQGDLQMLQSNPEFLDNTAVEPGARETIYHIMKPNKESITKELGRYEMTGVTLYNFKKVQKKQFYFTMHGEFVVVIKLVNDNIGNDKLVANENCRIPILRCLNAQVKAAMRQMKMVEFGRLKKYYNIDHDQSLDLEGIRISLFKGFKTAFEVYSSGPRLVVNFCCRIVREKTVWQEFCEQLPRFKGGEKEAFEELFAGKTAITTYGNHRPYIIDGADFKKRPSDPFPNKDYKSFVHYFESKYKAKITAKDQFLVYSNQRIRQSDGSFKEETNWFLPELLRPTGLTDEMRKNFKIMQQLSRETIKPPAERFSLCDAKVKELSQVLGKQDGVQIELEPRAPQIPGLIMSSPEISGFKKLTFAIKKDRIDVSSIAEPCEITNWVMVYEKFVEANTYIINENFAKACKRYNIRYKEPDDYVVVQKQPNAESIWEMIGKSKCPKPQMVMFFFGKKAANERFYSSVKRLFDSKGVATQFFTSFNPNKDTSGLAKYSNLLLQMANKLKCNLWYIETQLRDTLVLGADVCHGAKNQSVAALVGMWGSCLQDSYSATSIQKKGQEVMLNVPKMVMEIVDAYIEKVRSPPAQIIFYRDGVGEGQLAEVAHVEVKAIKEALAKKFEKAAPKLMFVVVTKRLDDRFAMQFQGLENPDSGLIVNKDVVKKDLYHFFMVSQKVTQGTATPTSYEIIFDEIKLDQQFFYTFTYHQTFNYYNWMGAVKVPAAVQYAHKLCGEKALTMDLNVPKKFREQKYYM